MKERTFYTFNLDITRMIILAAVLLLIIGYVFMLGRSIGKKTGKPEDATVTTELNKTSPEKVPIKEDKGVIPPTNSEDASKTKSDVVELPNKEAGTENVSNPPKDNKDTSKEADLTIKKDLENSTPITVEGEDNKDPIKTPIKKKKKLAKARTIQYTIQLGAFSTLELANRFKTQLISNNKIETTPYIQKRGSLFAVKLGESTDKAELKKIIESLDPSIAKNAKIVRATKGNIIE